MKKLVILDYVEGTAHFYDVAPNITIDDCFINSLGFHANDCEWMFGDSIEITYHREVLK